MRALDRLCLGWLLGLTAVVLLRWPPEWRWLLARYGGLLAALLLLMRAPQRGVLLHMHQLFVLLLIPHLFDSMAQLAPWVVPWRLDGLLARADRLLFGTDPVRWAVAHRGPGADLLFHLGYLTYYAMVPLLLLRLYLAGRREEYLRCAFVLTLGYALCYLGYMLLPARGPRVPLETRGFVSWVRRTLAFLENVQYDAFPSGHAETAFLCLALSRRHCPELLWFLVPATALLLPSTVWCGYHYAVDLIAGALWAWGCLRLAPPLERLLRGPADTCGSACRAGPPPSWPWR